MEQPFLGDVEGSSRGSEMVALSPQQTRPLTSWLDSLGSKFSGICLRNKDLLPLHHPLEQQKAWTVNDDALVDWLLLDKRGKKIPEIKFLIRVTMMRAVTFFVHFELA